MVKVLVTGGAGYIGSHVVRLLQSRGDTVEVVDNSSVVSHERLRGALVHNIDLSHDDSPEYLRPLLRGVDAVIHFAAKKVVEESVRSPLYYYRQNVGSMINVLESARDAAVSKIIFSSSAAVYGDVASGSVDEDAPLRPMNAYGHTKLVCEELLRYACSAYDMRAIALRYFNVAGAGWPDLGDSTGMNLIPMVFDRILAGQQPVVFGTDYPTRDGSCVRDFVHVLDLSQAHLAALDSDHVGNDTDFAAINVGTGRGHSVLEVIRAIKDVTGANLEPIYAGRRPGDPPSVVADVRRAASELRWESEYSLYQMVRSAWDARVHRQ